MKANRLIVLKLSYYCIYYIHTYINITALLVFLCRQVMFLFFNIMDILEVAVCSAMGVACICIRDMLRHADAMLC